MMKVMMSIMAKMIKMIKIIMINLTSSWVEDPKAASTAEEIEGPSWSITTSRIMMIIIIIIIMIFNNHLEDNIDHTYFHFDY